MCIKFDKWFVQYLFQEWFTNINYQVCHQVNFNSDMSRNNVFKLSGNMALGSGGPIDTYSTTELQSIKSSLRLLKARQNQKRSQHNIDYQNNNGYTGPYTANIPVRSQIRKPSNIIKDNQYYQSNAKNHIPLSYHDSQNNTNSKNDRDRGGSKFQNYDEQKNFPVRNRNQNFSHKLKNQYNYNNQPSIKDLNKRQVKHRVESNDNVAQKMAFNRQQQEYRSKNQQPSRQPIKKVQSNVNQRNYQNADNFQNVPIKVANKQKKVQIVEYDPSQLVLCSAGCGRKFNPDSIDKHQTICVKVFQKKRKQFNAQQHRILNNQHKKIIKNMDYEQKKQNTKGNNAKGKTQKMPKWKAQSLALRAGLKSNKNQPVSVQQQKILDQAKNVGIMKCLYCGRSFNQTAGPKHIKFCQQQSKKATLKKK